MFWDNTMILLIPAIIITFWAQSQVNSAFNKYSNEKSINRYTGAEAARILLDAAGLNNVNIEITDGKLTDHYDPKDKVIRLSYDVYNGDSISSIGVAAHETGHAIQDKQNYYPLVLRDSIVPIVNFSSNASWIILLLGFMFGLRPLIKLGILLFSCVVIFELVTLPVEFNASHRALVNLQNSGILYKDEIKDARKVLKAAAMTYVAAALMAISQLIRLIVLNRRED